VCQGWEPSSPAGRLGPLLLGPANSWYPSSHSQWYDPGWFTQVCSQKPFWFRHSSTSATDVVIAEDVLMMVSINIYINYVSF